MQYCRECILPDTRPGITLDADGVCTACHGHRDKEAKIEWDARAAAFADLVQETKDRAENYDCIVPVSGGKDSWYQVIKAREQGLSILAVTWNYLYNWAFDHVLLIKAKTLSKTLYHRIIHVIGYEAGFLIMGVPIIAYMLEMNLWQAFLTNIGFILFFLIYAFAYNWAYDVVFPVNQESSPLKES